MVTNAKCLRLAVAFFAILLPALAHAQTTDKFAATLTSDERKDLKALQDDWTKHEKMSDFSGIQAKSLVMSQMILGRLGYGATFTGLADERTKEAIKAYQANKGLTFTGVLDAETFWSLTRDGDLADKNVVTLAPFDLNWYSDFVSTSGAWDRINDREGYLQSSTIECDRGNNKCSEVDAMLLFNVLAAKKTEFTITKWDEYELVAEDSTPDCERDELRITHQEKSVTIISAPTYKNASCTKTLGKPETVTYRLVSGQQISADRSAALQNQRKSLYLISPDAKAILDKKD
jgi:peptidoglycan hydrolase-like protein with peptidoglycan-binding domain